MSTIVAFHFTNLPTTPALKCKRRTNEAGGPLTVHRARQATKRQHRERPVYPSKEAPALIHQFAGDMGVMTRKLVQAFQLHHGEEERWTLGLTFQS